MALLFYAVLVVFVILGVAYAISGIDDLVFDIVYWVRRLRGRPYRPVRLSVLDGMNEQRFAIFIPTWQEAALIEETVRDHVRRIDYGAYDIFVGTYPNDPDTQAAVDRAAADLPNVHKVVGPTPGPTTKADNLNAILAAVEAHEDATGLHYDAVLLHDAEDILHPYELKLVNLHLRLETADMIQTPITPVRTDYGEFTHGTYMDQFAESQTKDMYVRGWLRGFVPSCGVGTALSRRAVELLKSENPSGLAFDPESLTEDYEFGLKLALAGMKGKFVRQKVRQDRPPKEGVEPSDWVMTRSEFPFKASTSIRQRARWTLGIVFQSWKRNGWPGRFVHKWLLFHDRKAAWTYPLVLVGYVFLATLLIYTFVRTTFDLGPPLYLIPEGSWVWWTLIALSVLMLNRLLQRAIAVGRVYGPGHAVASIVRQPWDNVLNIGAVFRAYREVMRSRRDGTPPAWDKTTHTVPAATLQHGDGATSAPTHVRASKTRSS